MADRREINLYLFYEFGVEGDEAQVSDTWPFELREIDTLKAGGYETKVYQFSDAGQDYYALDLDGLTFYPAKGMTVEFLRLQELGRLWLGRRNPINLDMVRLDDPAVPSTRERRADIQEIASQLLGVAPESIKVLEGLFFKDDGLYLALVEMEQDKQAYVVGSKIGPHPVGLPGASSWRRLSGGIGEMLRAGSLAHGS